jgi:hypothetical protein
VLCRGGVLTKWQSMEEWDRIIPIIQRIRVDV